jgi:hypothetical protein
LIITAGLFERAVDRNAFNKVGMDERVDQNAVKKFDFGESRISARKLNICAVNLLVAQIGMPDSKS